MGKASRKIINESRSSIFKVFGKSEQDTKLFFHSGATEGISTIARSFAEETRQTGRDLLICYSRIDHPAVSSLKENFLGSHVSFFELARSNDLFYAHNKNFDALQELKNKNPNLVILLHHLWVHNETGHVSPLEELSCFKNISDLYIHVDAVQAPGKVQDWRVIDRGDYWTFSAHKFGALKGCGFTFFRKELTFHPLLSGGGQQSGLRSGTENPMAVKSVALALEDLLKVDVEKLSKLRLELVDFFNKELSGIGAVVTAESSRMCANTIYFYLDRLTSDMSLALFDLNGIMISAGSACQSGAAKDSEVLLQLGKGKTAKNGLRLSFGFDFSAETLRSIQNGISHVFSRLR